MSVKIPKHQRKGRKLNSQGIWWTPSSINWYAASVYYLPTHQLKALLEVDWPDDQEVTNGEDEQQEERDLKQTKLAHAAVVEDGLSPVRQAMLQHIVVAETNNHACTAPVGITRSISNRNRKLALGLD